MSKKNFIKITDDKGVEHVFYNFTSLVEYIDSFIMSFLPDGFTYLIQEADDDREAEPDIDLSSMPSLAELTEAGAVARETESEEEQ